MSSYADPSFLVSLYVLDANSALAAAQMKRASLPILLTPFGELELTNAILQRLFRKELLPSKIKAANALLKKDIDAGVFVLQPWGVAVFEKAKQIARKRTPQIGARTLDILHVASALVLRADAFFTFDRIQGKLARTEGLTVP
ncbi:MAG TPA: type II toxin-antitoxin system VapC family toxin [Acidobacteriota bacterium]